MQTQEKLIPKLRFPEFSGEWKSKRLGELFDFLKGKNLSKSNIIEEGENACILYGELFTSYNEIVKNIVSYTNCINGTELIKNDILLPCSTTTSSIDLVKASTVKVNNVLAGGDITILRNKKNIKTNSEMLSYYISNYNRKEIAKLAQGITIIHLYGKDLKSVNVNIPTLPEQEKIGEFLSLFDERIQKQDGLIKKLETHKKGLMQKIFNQEICFKDENGNNYPAWQQKKLGEVVDVLTDYVANGSFATIRENVKYLENGYAVLLRTQDNNNGYKGPFVYIDEKAYEFLNKSKLFKDDIVISNVGAVGTVFKVPDFEKPLSLAPNAILLKTNEINDFIYYYLKSDIGQNEIKKITVTTAQPKFNKTDFRTVNFNLPTLSEQQKIAEVLTECDNNIEKEKQKLEQLKQYKKYLLQNMLV